jgi:hypothetical protein
VSARRWWITVAVATSIATAAAVAIANHAPVADPNDTRGPLDVRRVELEHDDGPPEWTVLTFQSWTTHSMWDRGHAFVFVDTLGTSEADYFVHVGSAGRRMKGSLWRIPPVASRRDRRIHTITVWRDSNAGVSARLPLGMMNIGEHRTSFRWWVVTSYLGNRCRVTCIDRVPNSGLVAQWLPGHSPTPSPTGSTGP